jgi:L-iditol 2-dehydrogenase
VSTAPPARTTRAVVFHASGDLRLVDASLAAPGPGEVIIRVTACGLCPGEVMDWYVAQKAPVPLGHEPVGEVVAAGAGARLHVGDRVFVHHHAPCMGCRACRRGDHVQCAVWRPRRLIPGGLATHALVQAESVRHDTLALPPTMSDEVATFIEPLACVVKSLRRARVRPEDRVLVIGAGVMGLLHLQVLRVTGIAATTLAADLRADRVSFARAYADAAIDVSVTSLPDAVRAATDGDGADVVIVGPGSLDALDAGLASVAPAGTLLVFTPLPPEQPWGLNVNDIFFREVSVIPSYSAGPDDTREALRLLSEGLPVADLITHRLPLERAAEGYDLLRTGRALKVVVRP